jgi:hypothetical protein
MDCSTRKEAERYTWKKPGILAEFEAHPPRMMEAICPVCGSLAGATKLMIRSAP